MLTYDKTTGVDALEKIRDKLDTYAATLRKNQAEILSQETTIEQLTDTLEGLLWGTAIPREHWRYSNGHEPVAAAIWLLWTLNPARYEIDTPENMNAKGSLPHLPGLSLLNVAIRVRDKTAFSKSFIEREVMDSNATVSWTTIVETSDDGSHEDWKDWIRKGDAEIATVEKKPALED